MSKNLIAFYSRADENYVSGVLKNLDVGNTEVIARMIAEITGGDLFHIIQKNPYSKEYNACVNEAKIDQRDDKRPALVSFPSSIDEYDVIYLGFPNYWSSMPMAVFTFLEHFDFSGKSIRVFITHEGSGEGKSLEDIKKLCPKSDIKDYITIYGSRVNNERARVKSWVEGN